MLCGDRAADSVVVFAAAQAKKYSNSNGMNGIPEIWESGLPSQLPQPAQPTGLSRDPRENRGSAEVKTEGGLK